MKIKDAIKVIKCDRVHRMGAKRNGRNAQPRPIVAKFNPYGCKETVLQNVSKLTGTTESLNSFPLKLTRGGEA